jgi:C-terminal processing protease CtpA/Prc
MEYSPHEVRPLLVRALLPVAIVVLAASHAAAQDPVVPDPSELAPGGVGMVIGHRDGHLTIMQVLPSMSAARAGLREGDRVVRIEQTPTRPLLLVQAASQLRGEPGTEVTVWVSRERKRGRWSRPRAYRLVRELLPQVMP